MEEGYKGLKLKEGCFDRLAVAMETYYVQKVTYLPMIDRVGSNDSSEYKDYN